jgi:DNA invertase Pin-like site-specific DNA recombinase
MQERDLTEYAVKRGWQFQILEDKATGKNANRPALKKLMLMAQRREVDGIAVWKCDRLFRSLKHAVLTLSEWTELGIEFVALKDNIDLTTSQGRMLANLLLSFAEFQGDLIRSNVIDGLETAKARGVKLGRPQVVNDAVIAEVIELRTKGLSIRQISESLDKRISKTSIERVLRDHFNNPSKKVGI